MKGSYLNFQGTICMALRAVREYRNKTQEQVRFDIGCDVSNIENFRSCPSLLIFVKLCDYYRVDSGQFLTLINLSFIAKKNIKILIIERITECEKNI
jgi:hypothetical protein